MPASEMTLVLEGGVFSLDCVAGKMLEPSREQLRGWLPWPEPGTCCTQAKHLLGAGSIATKGGEQQDWVQGLPTASLPSHRTACSCRHVSRKGKGGSVLARTQVGGCGAIWLLTASDAWCARGHEGLSCCRCHAGAQLWSSPSRPGWWGGKRGFGWSVEPRVARGQVVAVEFSVDLPSSHCVRKLWIWPEKTRRSWMRAAVVTGPWQNI